VDQITHSKAPQKAADDLDATNAAPYARRSERYFDPDRLLDVVRGGHFEHHLVGGSEFGVFLERAHLGFDPSGAPLCGLDHGAYTMPILVRGTFDVSRVCFGFPLRMHEPSRVNGLTLSLDDVQIYAENAELLYRAGENAEWAAFWIARDDLQDQSNRLLGRPLELPARGMVNIRCNPDRMVCLREAVETTFQISAAAVQDPRIAEHALPSVRDHLITAYLLAVTSREDNGDAEQDGRRLRIAQRVLEYLDATPESPFSLDALCRQTSIGPRTLQVLFRDVCGMSARSYFLIERLHRARRDLLAGRSDRVGVTGVAMRLGFFHLSRFAGQYARLFGETPSQTVRLAAGRTLASSGPTHPVIQPRTRMITVP
jgi:AraC-like DNA-binding protein